MSDYFEEVTFYYSTRENDVEHTNINASKTVKEGMHIAEFHRFCKDFALMIGFCQNNVEEYFGETRFDDCE